MGVSIELALPRADVETHELQARLRAIDATIGVSHQPGSAIVRLKKDTSWSASDINRAEAVLRAAAPLTPKSRGRAAVEAWGDEQFALLDALVSEIGELRSLGGLSELTLQAFLARVRQRLVDAGAPAPAVRARASVARASRSAAPVARPPVTRRRRRK